MKRQIWAYLGLFLWISPALAADPVPLTAESPRPTPRLGGYIQARETYREGGPGLSGTINRARLTLDGSVRPNFTYRAAVELAAPSGTSVTPSMRDAYMKWTHNWLSATGGQFKTPFSREFINSLAILEVVDRATVVDTLATKRDIGAMVEGTWPLVTVSTGIFNGEGQNVTSNRDSTEIFIARAVARPIGPLSIGGEIATKGSRRRSFGGEFNAEYRGALLRGEYIGERIDGRDRDDYGWYILAGYRVMPWLQVLARQEDFQRPSLGVARRISATTAGFALDFPGGQTRLLLDYIGRTTGAARILTNNWIAQL